MSKRSRSGSSETPIELSDSDGEDFYSNFVSRTTQKRGHTTLLVDNVKPKKDPGAAKTNYLRGLDSDSDTAEEAELPLMQRLALKAKKDKEEQAKAKAKETRPDVLAGLECGTAQDMVQKLASYEAINDHIARIRHVKKTRFTKGINDDIIPSPTLNVDVKRARLPKCFIKINDLDDGHNTHPTISIEMNEKFSKIRELLAKKKECDVRGISLTYKTADIADKDTPTGLKFEADEIYTIDCLTMGGLELITLRCCQKDIRPIEIHVQKTDTFENIAILLRSKGARFEKIIFDGVPVADTDTPETHCLEDDDQLDLQ